MRMSKFQKLPLKLFTGISVGFASSLAFKTHVLRSDDNHSPLEANMVSGTSSHPMASEVQQPSACSCSCNCHHVVATWIVCRSFSSHLLVISLQTVRSSRASSRFCFAAWYAATIEAVRQAAELPFSAAETVNQQGVRCCLSDADNGKLHTSEPHTLRSAVLHGLLQKLGHYGAFGSQAAWEPVCHADVRNYCHTVNVWSIPLQAETFVFICEFPLDHSLNIL